MRIKESDCKLQTRRFLRNERDCYKEQLISLFERVSGCSISEFDRGQMPYLADMIEGQMDANEGCIDKLTDRVKELEEALRELDKTACAVVDLVNCNEDAMLDFSNAQHKAKKLIK